MERKRYINIDSATATTAVKSFDICNVVSGRLLRIVVSWLACKVVSLDGERNVNIRERGKERDT